MNRGKVFWAGVQAEAPLLLGVFPFGLIYGVLARGAGIPVSAAQAMSSVVFAGSSQMIAAQLLASATPSLVILVTIAVVNLRHALYSASISPYLEKFSLLWKFLLAYLLTDEAYAVGITYYQRDGMDPEGPYYLLGAGLMLWSTWQISTGLGILLGAVIPNSWGLDFTLALTFIALVMPLLRDRPAVAAALSAALTALLTLHFPLKLGLVTSALVGIAVGSWLEGRK